MYLRRIVKILMTILIYLYHQVVPFVLIRVQYFFVVKTERFIKKKNKDICFEIGKMFTKNSLINSKSSLPTLLNKILKYHKQNAED